MPRQKSKVNIYSYRTNLALLEYNFTFNLCRVVLEKLVFKVGLRYGSVWYGDSCKLTLNQTEQLYQLLTRKI